MKHKFICHIFILIEIYGLLITGATDTNTRSTSTDNDNEKLSQINDEFNSNKSQPQVIYIQYSTLEEAEEAKRQILAQYDAIGAKAIITDQLPASFFTNIKENIEIAADKTTEDTTTTTINTGKTDEKFS